MKKKWKVFNYCANCLRELIGLEQRIGICADCSNDL